MGTSKNSFSMTRSWFPLGNIRLRRADLRPRRGEDGTTRHRNKSTAVLRHSELRSVAEPQQCQSKLCHCTRLLQQSSFKVLNTTSMDALRHHYGSVTQPSKLGCVTEPYMVFTTFVLTHLLMQLGNGHASMSAALVLVNNHSAPHSFHKGIYEGSLSLRAKAQVFVFLA